MFHLAYDVDRHRLERFCTHYNISPAESLQQLIQESDLLLNLTNPESHYEVSRLALENAVPVYTEKPITPSEAQTNDLVRIAKTNNVNLFSAPCVHLSSIAEAVKVHLESGAIGRVHAVYAEMDNDIVHAKNYETWTNEFGVRWPAKNEFESGATLEHAAYTLCLLTKWFGRGTPKAIYQHVCFPDKVLPLHKKTADFSCALIEYPENIVARLTCSIVAPANHSIVIHGTEGVLTIDDIWFFDTSVYYQKYVALRSKRRLSPIKHKLKRPDDGFPLGQDTDKARMDFLRGVHELASKRTTDNDLMQSMADVNSLVLAMNGNANHEPQHPWLIVGTGNMGSRIVDCLKRNGYPIVGVFSAQKNRAAEFAAEYGLPTAYEELNEIPAAEFHTTAYVASLNSKHYEQVKTLLNKGYNVLCEKPLTLQPEQCKQLYDLANAKSLRLQENLWSLFLPAGIEMKRLSDACNTADLRFCSVIPYTAANRQWAAGEGGCVYDLGVYPLAWCVFLFGTIKDVSVYDVTIEHGVVSQFSAMVSHMNGKQSNLKAGFHTQEQYVKLGDDYFSPIYAPEHRSSLPFPILRKLKQRLRPAKYPAKDPYAHILADMNLTGVEETIRPHPASDSQHVADILDRLSRLCLSK